MKDEDHESDLLGDEPKKSLKQRVSIPFPRKIAAAIKNLPLEYGRINTQQQVLDVFDKSISKFEPETIQDFIRNFGPLIKNLDKLPPGSTYEDLYRQANDLMSRITTNNPAFMALIPIFLNKGPKKSLEPLASGVLIQICHETFLLTAAHVLDRETDGDLLIPGKEQLITLSGHYASMKLPASGKRIDDKFDVAYYCLDKECLQILSREYRALLRPEISLEGKPQFRRKYTIGGYPWRKTKVKLTDHTVQPELNTLEGLEGKQADYEEQGLSRDHHLIVKINRKRMFNSKLGRVVMPPSPSGMSGGGIYFLDTSPEGYPMLLLAGIATGFVPDRGLLLATRIEVFINCIFHNRPDLAALARGPK